MIKETGFPSPAQGYEAKNIDLNELLVRNKAATFFMRYEASAWADAGLFPGSRLVVDRSARPRNGGLVVVASEGEFRCRLWRVSYGKVFLVGPSGEEKPFAEGDLLFGTVTGVIRTV